MRAFELFDQKPKHLSLRRLHQLKKVRKARELELDKKKPFLSKMYGDPNAQAEQDRQELEDMERQLELVMDRIKLEIEAAEIETGQKEKIRTMAMRSVKKSLKN